MVVRRSIKASSVSRSAVRRCGTVPSSAFAQMSRIQNQVSESFRRDPDVVGVVGVLGIGQLNATTNTGHIAVTLKPREERKASAAEIGERLKRVANETIGVNLYVKPVQDIQISTRTSRSQYQYTLVGADANEVADWGARIATGLRDCPILRNLATETQVGGLRTMVRIDRDAAGRLGVSAQNIVDALNNAFGQRQVSTIYTQSNQ